MHGRDCSSSATHDELLTMYLPMKSVSAMKTRQQDESFKRSEDGPRNALFDEQFRTSVTSLVRRRNDEEVPLDGCWMVFRHVQYHRHSGLLTYLTLKAQYRDIYSTWM